MSRIYHLLRPALPALLLLLLVDCGDTATADDATITFGIEGHYRVGCWTGILYSGEAPFTTIETRDGDGVQAEYTQAGAVGNNEWGYLVPGSEAAPAILREEDAVILSSRFPTVGSPSRGAAMIPLKMPWIVALGDPLGVDQIGANKLLNRDALIAVSKPQRANRLPDSALGYDGVDMMMVSGSSADLFRELDGKQRDAISNWITSGGRVFLTLGESTLDFLDAAPWLRELLPIETPATTKIEPSAIENYTSTQTPLTNFVGIKLPKNVGRVLIMGRTTRRVSTPVAVEYNVGFGRITVVAADLEDELFAAWPERLDLITLLTGDILIPEEEQQEPKSRATAYGDLAGQMRTTLDQFSIRRNFGFSIVSLILMALIAAIGPLDYLLINRFFGRPLLGWLSFPLAAIGLSALLAYQSRPVVESPSAGRGVGTSGTVAASPGDGLRCNRIEIFDVDTLQGIGRGFAASYLYSHQASSVDVHVTENDSLASITDDMQQMLTTPFGYPGESFGGIQIAIEDARLPVYQIPFDRQGSSGNTRSYLKELPLASRSSKAFATRCWFRPRMSSDVTIQHRPGSELLQGELVNPLPFDLLDGKLVYRNWAYVLPTRFPSGGRIASLDSLRQKNFRWQLSRQKALEKSATETKPWDPTMQDSPERVAEMLMFHDVVGGSRYTTLRHDPLTFLDLSHVLVEDRCILIGRIAEPVTKIEAKNQDFTLDPAGKTLTLIRVVLPVRDAQRR